MARSTIDIQPLQANLSFGSRVSGLTLNALKDTGVKETLRKLFEDRGLIVFSDVEQSPAMQVALSEAFGKLKEFPLPSVKLVEHDQLPGIIDLTYTPDDPGARMGTVEVNGNIRHSWLPWHFDHCYNDTLNRAGVLCATIIPPEGGETWFSDGVELYQWLPDELRKPIEGKNIIYSLAGVPLDKIRFGRPDFRIHQRDVNAHAAILKQAETSPRAVHPAVWQRPDNRKVLHLCGYFACGIEGMENSEGDKLLDAACHEVNRLSDATCYRHQWQGTEMLIWDNWRLLHQACGADPKYPRSMQRSTILGDYGRGYFEKAQG